MRRDYRLQWLCSTLVLVLTATAAAAREPASRAFRAGPEPRALSKGWFSVSLGFTAGAGTRDQKDSGGGGAYGTAAANADANVIYCRI